MQKHLRIMLSCLGLAILTLVIVNLFAFGYELLSNGIGETWSIKLHHGMFYIDDNPIGMQIGSKLGNGFIFAIFFVLLFNTYRKDNLIVS